MGLLALGVEMLCDLEGSQLQGCPLAPSLPLSLVSRPSLICVIMCRSTTDLALPTSLSPLHTPHSGEIVQGLVKPPSDRLIAFPLFLPPFFSSL